MNKKIYSYYVEYFKSDFELKSTVSAYWYVVIVLLARLIPASYLPYVYSVATLILGLAISVRLCKE